MSRVGRIWVEGIDGVMATFVRRSERIRPMIAEALSAGASMLQGKLKDEAKRSFKAPSGMLAGKTEPTDVWHSPDASGGYVYPQGLYNGVRGTYARRAEEVAFVLEYGRGGARPMAANPWNRRATRKSEKQVNSIIMEELGGFE